MYFNMVSPQEHTQDIVKSTVNPIYISKIYPSTPHFHQFCLLDYYEVSVLQQPTCISTIDRSMEGFSPPSPGIHTAPTCLTPGEEVEQKTTPTLSQLWAQTHSFVPHNTDNMCFSEYLKNRVFFASIFICVCDMHVSVCMFSRVRVCVEARGSCLESSSITLLPIRCGRVSQSNSEAIGSS